MEQTMKRILGVVLATLAIGVAVTAPSAAVSALPGTTSNATSQTS